MNVLEVRSKGLFTLDDYVSECEAFLSSFSYFWIYEYMVNVCPPKTGIGRETRSTLACFTKHEKCTTFSILETSLPSQRRSVTLASRIWVWSRQALAQRSHYQSRKSVPHLKLASFRSHIRDSSVWTDSVGIFPDSIGKLISRKRTFSLLWVTLSRLVGHFNAFSWK